jgi:predicted RNA-binding Zn ribbon-like protein
MSYATATSRYGLREAPAGLALVQDFLNTRAIGDHGGDLLADHDTAQRWARAAVARWAADQGTDAPELTLTAVDLRRLRELRETFELLVGAPDDEGPDHDEARRSPHDPSAIGRSRPDHGEARHRPAPHDLIADVAPIAVTLVPGGGAVTLAPSGSGWRWLASALWIEAYRSQQDGRWPRLKRCRNTLCGSAFYDRSRNNSGVWHDVRTCGNVANLRRSRQRRRQQAT